MTGRNQNRPIEKIGVLGAGAWGTALAFTAQKAGRTVSVWAREPDVAGALSKGEGNPLFLPGIDLPVMNASTDLSVLEGADAILSVVPAQHARGVFADMADIIAPGTPVMLCSKGIEKSTLSLMTDVVHQTLPQATPAVLSGPSFAADVARGLPTAVTLACADKALGQALMTAIGRPAFRPYWSNDLIGTEIGGAVKNVLAIACGIVEGLELGKSAHAALIARGFAEMTRLAVAMGAQPQTLAGLCGLGDLVLTCSSTQSRNMSFGKALGEGRAAEDILEERNSVTEGVATAPALTEVAAKHGVDMPICAAVHEILDGQKNVDEAMNALLNRPFTQEGF